MITFYQKTDNNIFVYFEVLYFCIYKLLLEKSVCFATKLENWVLYSAKWLCSEKCIFFYSRLRNKPKAQFLLTMKNDSQIRGKSIIQKVSLWQCIKWGKQDYKRDFVFHQIAVSQKVIFFKLLYLKIWSLMQSIIQRALLKVIMVNRIIHLTRSNLIRFTSPKLLFYTLCMYLVNLLIVIIWSMGSLWVRPEMILLTGF